jgi:hypothetical protein
LQTNSLHNGTGNFHRYCREEFSTNRDFLARPFRAGSASSAKG